MQTTNSWITTVALRIVPLGVRNVKKSNGRVYTYKYLKIDVERFPEAERAYRLKLVIVPPDLSAPPVVITARRFQRSAKTIGFDVSTKFQAILDQYARNGFVAVLAVDLLEEDAAWSRQNKQPVEGGL